jgi:hypothetical protein
MNAPVQDLAVTLKDLDVTRLATAQEHQRRLEGFLGWEQPSDSVFLKEMGENLFHLAFPTPYQVDRFASQFAAAVAARGVLRLWLHAADPHAAMLPWEYLCLTEEAVERCRTHGVPIQKHQPHTTLPDDQTFLTLHPHVALIRQALPKPLDTDLNRVGVLRVLVAWADPGRRGGNWPAITGLELEVQSILGELQSLRSNLVEVRELPHATRSTLKRVLEEWRPQVLHFAGHGAFPGLDDPGDLTAPSLVLESDNPTGRPRHDYLTAVELRILCADAGTQVVVLNACWGGCTSPNFTGVAHALAAPDQGPAVPVVVAHQLPIPQAAAVRFARPFYLNLVLARRIEDGVHTFRRDTLAAHPYGCGAPDWGIPVVFLGVRDSTLVRTERIDPYPISFGAIIREHVPIVGRDFLRERFARFQGEHAQGIFLLTAPPGTGKTAFLAQWADREPDTTRFFFRATAGLTDPDECLRSLVHELLGKYRIINEQPPGNEIELRRYFRTLLDKVSGYCARDGRREVILIDALDEAGKAACDGQGIADILPVDLPKHVYLFLTSRPGPVVEQVAGRHSGCPVKDEHLDPASADNLNDAAAFCRRELHGRVEDADAAALERLGEQLARQANGNFLVLKLTLGRQSLGDRVSVAQLQEVARHLTGEVKEAYRQFFDRVERRFGDQFAELDFVYLVLGALATASAPVTPSLIQGALDIAPYRWERALRHISQFLERGGVRQQERGALTYRLYHETFREFLLDKLGRDVPAQHRQWSKLCGRWRELDGYARLYALRYLPTHLLAAAAGPKDTRGGTV